MKKARQKKPHTVWFHLYDISGKSKLLDTERLVAAWGVEWGLTGSGHEGSSWGDENVPELIDGDGGTTQ